MEKLKTLTIILFFMLLLSTTIALGVFCLVDFKYFKITLGTTYILSTIFVFAQFILIMLNGAKKWEIF